MDGKPTGCIFCIQRTSTFYIINSIQNGASLKKYPKKAQRFLSSSKSLFRYLSHVRVYTLPAGNTHFRCSLCFFHLGLWQFKHFQCSLCFFHLGLWQFKHFQCSLCFFHPGLWQFKHFQCSLCFFHPGLWQFNSFPLISLLFIFVRHNLVHI